MSCRAAASILLLLLVLLPVAAACILPLFSCILCFTYVYVRPVHESFGVDLNAVYGMLLPLFASYISLNIFSFGIRLFRGRVATVQIKTF